jgi:hypothetical protein
VQKFSGPPAPGRYLYLVVFEVHFLPNYLRAMDISQSPSLSKPYSQTPPPIGDFDADLRRKMQVLKKNPTCFLVFERPEAPTA